MQFVAMAATRRSILLLAALALPSAPGHRLTVPPPSLGEEQISEDSMAKLLENLDGAMQQKMREGGLPTQGASAAGASPANTVRSRKVHHMRATIMDENRSPEQVELDQKTRMRALQTANAALKRMEEAQKQRDQLQADVDKQRELASVAQKAVEEKARKAQLLKNEVSEKQRALAAAHEIKKEGDEMIRAAAKLHSQAAVEARSATLEEQDAKRRAERAQAAVADAMQEARTAEAKAARQRTMTFVLGFGMLALVAGAAWFAAKEKSDRHLAEKSAEETSKRVSLLWCRSRKRLEESKKRLDAAQQRVENAEERAQEAKQEAEQKMSRARRVFAQAEQYAQAHGWKWAQEQAAATSEADPWRFVPVLMVLTSLAIILFLYIFKGAVLRSMGVAVLSGAERVEAAMIDQLRLLGRTAMQHVP